MSHNLFASMGVRLKLGIFTIVWMISSIGEIQGSIQTRPNTCNRAIKPVILFHSKCTKYPF